MEPLAYRMKPTSLDDFYGQDEIVGKDKLVNKKSEECKFFTFFSKHQFFTSKYSKKVIKFFL